MSDAFICDAIRTPFGRYGGALSTIRTDDLAAIPVKALIERNPSVDWNALDDVILGCANQAGEDNRNVARMALLLAGLPLTVPGSTVNRLCGSSLDAISIAARAIKSGENALVIAGGVESMSRAPFVMGKADAAFSRGMKMEDTTIGWRFVNPLMKAQYGVDSMPETGENVAEEFGISRQDQDAFAYRSQQRAEAARQSGALAEEITPVAIAARKGAPLVVDKDEHPRPDTTLEALAALKPIVKANGTITAGNASGVNDGAGAVLLASAEAVKRHGLKPKARVVAAAASGSGAPHHGHGTCSGNAQGAGVGGSYHRRYGRDRVERGFRFTSTGRAPRPEDSGRRSPREPKRRSHRARSPAGCKRCAAGHRCRLAVATYRGSLCAMHHVHRSGTRYRDNSGTGLAVHARARLNAVSIPARHRVTGLCNIIRSSKSDSSCAAAVESQ